MNIHIKKGHDIKISGEPSDKMITSQAPTSVAMLPVNFKGKKPKLLVGANDKVKIGSPLFFDKNNPELKWASPGGGIVKEIQYGPRRVLEKIEIELDKHEESIVHKKWTETEINTLSGETVINTILEGNLFHLIRQRPFNKIANPKQKPRDIFISTINSAPLTVNLDMALKSKLTQFQAGITALSKLTSGKLYLGMKPQSIFNEVIHAEKITVSGPHPSGNVGIQIHHVAPIKPRDIIWTVHAQDVVVLGQLFLTGKYDPSLVVSLGGPKIQKPVHVQSRAGVPIRHLLKDQEPKEAVRIISGDVLTGTVKQEAGFLDFYDSTITVLSDSINREFMSMLKPGHATSRYSLSSAFLKFGNRIFPFNTSQNGSHRALVPLNIWEKVLPMDIYPNALYRSIIAQDIEEMEQLGIWECDEEDFALCSFACPSKTDVGRMIRKGLDLMEAEG